MDAAKMFFVSLRPLILNKNIRKKNKLCLNVC